jgi:hypothetical protein
MSTPLMPPGPSRSSHLLPSQSLSQSVRPPCRSAPAATALHPSPPASAAAIDAGRCCFLGRCRCRCRCVTVASLRRPCLYDAAGDVK